MRAAIIFIFTFLFIMIYILYILYRKYTMDQELLRSSFKNWKSYKIKDKAKDKYKNKRKKICIVTLETRKTNMLEIHDKNLYQYAISHGYLYFTLNSYKNDLKLPIYWQKLQVVKDLLQLNNKGEDVFDYVMWMDSDTIIIDPSISLESVMDNENKSIYIGKDFTSEHNYNAGVFIIKNDQRGKSFINDCISTYLNKEECKDKDGNYALNGGWSGNCYEQGVMNELLLSTYSNDFMLLDPYIAYNHNIPTTNCFILHLFGGTAKYEHRDEVFKDILENGKKYEKRIDQMGYAINYGINRLKQKFLEFMSKKDQI